MPIDPQVLEHYSRPATLPAPKTLDDIRRNADITYNDKKAFPPVFRVTDDAVPQDWGTIPVRVYEPGSEGPYPVFLYFHGGGFIMHNIASHDSLCRLLANECNAVIVNVGYRLAPEYKWPACMDDAYAALLWTVRNTEKYNIDASKIAVGGDSAGAMISAVLCQTARDANGPKIGLQVLAYGAPCGLKKEESESLRELAPKGYVLSEAFLEFFEGLYDNHEHDGNPKKDAGQNPDLSNLPKLLSMNAEYDPLRDDGEEYARRLKAAGNEVISERVPGMFHGFLLLWDEFDRSREVVSRIAEVFKETFR